MKMKTIILSTALALQLSVSGYANQEQLGTESTVTSTKKFDYLKREPTQDKYYNMIQKHGRDIERQLMSKNSTRPIVDASSFVTAHLVTKEVDSTGNHQDVLFLGYSAGHVLKVIFTNENWTTIKSAELTQEQGKVGTSDYNVNKDWELEVTALAYDPESKRLYIGYGDKVERDWRHGLGFGKKMELLKPNSWFQLDTDNIYTEEHKTIGGGIRVYDYYDSKGNGKSNGYDQRGTISSEQDRTAVQIMYPQVTEDGSKSLYVAWGSDRAAQTYTFGVSIVPVPKPIPIPMFSGGDNPSPNNPRMQIFNTNLAFNAEQNVYYNQHWMQSKPINNTQKPNDVPSFAVTGHYAHDTLIYGYNDGSVWAYNIAGGPQDTWVELNKPIGVKIVNMLYSETDGKEHILVSFANNHIWEIVYDHQTGIFNKKVVHNGGWGSNVVQSKVSKDGKYAILVLANKSIQWYSFLSGKPTAPIANPENAPPITAITSPVETESKGVYKFFVAYANGVLREGSYSASLVYPVGGGNPVETNRLLSFKDISAHANIPITVNFNGGRQRLQTLRHNISIIFDCHSTPLSAYGMLDFTSRIIGKQTGLGCLEYGPENRYHYTKLDYDKTSDTLYAYTDNLIGKIENPNWEAHNGKDRVIDARVGMGIDTYNSKTNKWSVMQSPKFMFMDKNQATARQFKDMEFVYPYPRLSQGG